MRRREFIAGFLVAATARRTRAQQVLKQHRIAVVHETASISDMMNPNDPVFGPFFQELHRLGYIEGQNIVVERYSGEGRTERYGEFVREVVRAEPDLIFTTGPLVLLKLKAATFTISIVGITSDPVAFGFVGSVARPGANITGISVDAGIEVWGKRVEILKEAVPMMSKVSFLARRGSWEGPPGAAVRAAVERLGISFRSSPLEGDMGEAEYRRVFAAMSREGVDGLVVEASPANFTYRCLIIDLAERARLPAIYWLAIIWMSAGSWPTGMTLRTFRRAARYVDQILKGVKPGEIPFYQATQYQLIINLKAAKSLGLTIPPGLLLRADEIVE